VSDERGRGAADDEPKAANEPTAGEPTAGEPTAGEPEAGSADWLLQQLTGGRHVTPPAQRREREESETERPPVAEQPPVSEQPPVAEQHPVDERTPVEPIPPSTPRPSAQAGFDDLLGSVLEEPAAVDDGQTEFPVAFNWNLTPGAGGDPLVEASSVEDSVRADSEDGPAASEDVPAPPPAPAAAPVLPPQPPIVPPLVSPVYRAPVVEPPVVEPSPVESVGEESPLDAPAEEPPARSWVIPAAEPAAPVAPAADEKPRTIFDSPATDVPDGDDTADGHGLAALLGFGPSEPDKPSSRSVIGDTTSIIPLNPSAFTRPPAPSAPSEAVPSTPEPPQQPVLPPLDAAALLEPGVDTPTQQLDAAEMAALLRPRREDGPPVLPSEPAVPAAQAEVALGGVPSPATSPIDAESIAAASEPEAEPQPFGRWTAEVAATAGEPAASVDADDDAADDLGDDDKADGISALFGDVVAAEPVDEDLDDDQHPTGPAERQAGPEPVAAPEPATEPEPQAEPKPEPAAEEEGPKLLATTPFTMPPTDARPFSAQESSRTLSAPSDSSLPQTEAFTPFPSAPAAVAAPAVPAGPLPPSASTGTQTASPAGPAGPTGPGLWGSRNNRILFSLAGALAVVLVLIGLFALGTRIPSLFRAAQPVPVSTASHPASPSPKPTPTPTPTPTVTPKPAAAVGPGVHPWDTLGGGECIQPFTNVWAQEFTVVDCATPHAAQLVYTNLLSADPAAPYPGVDALAQQIPGLCTAGGVIDLGAAAAYPDLQVVGSYPATEQQWKDGQRSYYCFANRSGGEPLTSSVAGPGPAA